MPYGNSKYLHICSTRVLLLSEYPFSCLRQSNKEDSVEPLAAFSPCKLPDKFPEARLVIREFLCIICTEGSKRTHIRETVSSAVCSHDTDMLIPNTFWTALPFAVEQLVFRYIPTYKKTFLPKPSGQGSWKAADIYITLITLTVIMTNGEFKHVKTGNVHVT